MVTRRAALGMIGSILVWALLLALAVIVLYPLFWMLMNGLKTNSQLLTDPFALPSTLNWENYAKAWNNGVSSFLTMSLLVTITSTVATVFVSAWAAYGLTKVTLPFGRFTMFLILGGLMLAPTVALIPLVRMFQALGLYNTYWALMILYIAFRIPFTTFLIRAYMIDLPTEVDEAAMMDGASKWTTFWRITLPMSKPIIVSAVILQVLFAWNEYLFAMIFTGGSEFATLPVGLTNLMAKHGTDYPVVFAAMAIAALPMVLIFFAGQRYFVLGLSEGVGK